jgi:hypothetical protein
MLLFNFTSLSEARPRCRPQITDRKIQDQTLQMKKILRIAMILCIVHGVLGLSAVSSPGQESAASSFPDKALEGEEDFSFALLFQGDARGNFGPCG